MELYLLRHADADTPAATDHERALSEKGKEQAARVARFCKEQRLVPELILSSPVRRAHETAEAVARHLEAELQEARWLTSGMQPETALEELRGHREVASVMIVGHEPDFSKLAAHLLGLPSNALIHIRKASLSLLELSTFRAGTARLEFSIPCKMM